MNDMHPHTCSHSLVMTPDEFNQEFAAKDTECITIHIKAVGKSSPFMAQPSIFAMKDGYAHPFLLQRAGDTYFVQNVAVDKVYQPSPVYEERMIWSLRRLYTILNERRAYLTQHGVDTCVHIRETIHLYMLERAEILLMQRIKFSDIHHYMDFNENAYEPAPRTVVEFMKGLHEESKKAFENTLKCKQAILDHMKTDGDVPYHGDEVVFQREIHSYVKAYANEPDTALKRWLLNKGV